MVKSKWLVVIAALALLVLAAGCVAVPESAPATATTGAAEAEALPVAEATAEPTAAATEAAPAQVEPTSAVTTTETISPTATTAAAEPSATLEMPEQSEAVQGWPVLWDPEIGFEVYYPAGWLVGEVEVTEQDAPITRVYSLQPAGWAEDWSPVLVEVSEGGEADFRKAYIEPAETEERAIGPLTYTYETSGSEGSMENFAVFTSPDNPELRVVIRDVVTGFGERAQANADFAQLIQTIIESFRWRK